ncbi:MAG: GNAT family N-acetyltransferase [Clostridia bacterium]|nr:GNAT family N-acetyltransferase [Clostridia bacterium]
MVQLHFEPLCEQYLEDLQLLWSDPAVIRYTGTPEPYTLEQTRQKLHRLQQSDVFVILQDHVFVGIVGCLCIDNKTVQFGLFYLLKQSVWGQGCATASVHWMLDYMNQKYKHPILYADVISENTASEKILKHLHFICQSESKPVYHAGPEAIVRHYVLHPTI